MLEKQEMELRDKCLRAYGTLCNCTLLPIEELTADMVKIKLGIALGFFKVRDMRDFNDFLADMRPASFVIENELQHVTEKERDACRAEIVGKVLPELVSRIR
jgi:protein-arginine kinase